jgi:hypothetical protein
MARRIEVELIGDSRSLERAFARSERSAKQFNSTMERAGRGALAGTVAFKGFGRSIAFASGGFLTGAGIAAGAKAAISAASDLNEQMSKNRQVFQQSAGQIQDWSETTASAFGISQRAALATASSFGALFAPMGLVGDKAAEQSRKLTELGADLASFYNTDVSDALDAIRSGIVGESEPLRRYGVLLSETRVQAEALAETHKHSAADLTAAEKALARITLIMRDTEKAQGDFARTSDGLANQTRKLRAEWDNLSTHIGQTYVPMLTRLAHAANEAFEAFSGGADHATASAREQVTLIPMLAHMYEVLRERGVSAGDAIEILERKLDGGEKAVTLVGDAIAYSGDESGKWVEKIAKLRGQLEGFQVDAEAAAKAAYGVGIGLRDAAAAAPRGLAALQPGVRLGVAGAAAALTPGVADDLRVLQQQHDLYQRQARSIRNRLGRATGKRAATLAGQLEQVLADDRSALDRIAAIQADIRQKTEAAAQRQKDAIQRQKDIAARAAAAAKARQQAAAAARQAAAERARGWLDFGIERAQATKTVRDDLRAYRALETWLKARIRQEGRTLELARDLWETRQKIRDLNKRKAVDGDPLAGLMQVSSRRLAAMLAAGTGLDAAGRRILGANIAAAEIQPVHVHVNLDGREVASVVTKHQARTAHRTARQTSGFRG